MEFFLGLSMPSLLYGPEKGLEWQDALTLQPKVGSFSVAPPGPMIVSSTKQYLLHLRITSSLFSERTSA